MDIHKGKDSKALAEVWGDYVDWDKRRLGENGFLISTLKRFNCREVFDAGLGDGADSIYLLRNGFEVTSNELDRHFILKAEENSEKHDIRLKITEYDWADLDKHFQENDFGAVVCFGNSLTHIFGRDNQLRVLRNFYRILKKGGILIADERNFQYILDKKDEIVNGGRFRYTGKYVYCGDKVHGRPVEVSDDRVCFEIENERTGDKWHFLIYPFKRGELLSLLKEAGFSKVEQYSDYRRGYNPDADFHQYVCVK